jgi:roadblock/LC7 domain-containing protein
MAETTKHGNKMLVESIDRINATNLVLEDKWIEYLIAIDEATNNMQKDMVQALNNMTQVMAMAFMWTTTNNNK